MKEKKYKKKITLLITFILSIMLHIFVVQEFVHIKFTVRDIFSDGKKKAISITIVKKIGRIIKYHPEPVKKAAKKAGISTLNGKESLSVKAKPGGKSKFTAFRENTENIIKETSTDIAPPKGGEDTAGHSRMIVDPYKIINSRAMQDELDKSIKDNSRVKNTFDTKLSLFSRAGRSGSRGIINYGRDKFIEGNGYDITPWAEKVINKIYRNWYVMDLFKRDDTRGGVAGVSVEINRQGRILVVKVGKSSSNPLFDSSALNAVNMSVPLPPFPDYFPVNKLKVYFLFNFNE